MTAPSTEPTTIPADPAGATPPNPAPTPPADPAQPLAEPLGDAGKKALQAERDARRALEQQLKDLKPLVDFVSQVRGGQAVPDSQKTEAEQLSTRIAELEKAAADERQARIRLEVAAEKGLTPDQAARLQGATREELAADADSLKALFPTAAPAPGTPAPDPSQGARGAASADLEALIAKAQADGNVREVLRLKARQLAAIKPTQ